MVVGGGQRREERERKREKERKKDKSKGRSNNYVLQHLHSEETERERKHVTNKQTNKSKEDTNNEGKFLYINATSCHICANEKTHFAIFKFVNVGIALGLRAVRVHNSTRIFHINLGTWVAERKRERGSSATLLLLLRMQPFSH